MKLIFLSLFALTTAQFTTSCSTGSAITTTSNKTVAGENDINTAEQEILDYTNRERKKAGLPALTVNDKLTKAATDYARLMAKEGQLSHTVNGTTVVKRYAGLGYSWTYYAENVALNSVLDGQAAVEDMWMKSSGHRANILNKTITEIGVGIAYSKKTGYYYYCQDFGRPKSN